MLGRRPDAVRVIPGVWLGSAPSTAQARRLAREGITVVVDLRAEAAERAAWPGTVRVVPIPMVDHGTPTAAEVSSAASQVSRLVRDGEEVLVHCRAGLERSPTVVCATLMLQGWSLADAYRRVTEARSGAAPTEGQLSVLRSIAGNAGAGAAGEHR